ncbi:MAG: N-acetylmuramoyl-L-alanine amidase, partial [Anaerolineae bacterium]|nr:N-acetylmuramoyl-L-alanine amidase [Anaerolineae bacterium]
MRYLTLILIVALSAGALPAAAQDGGPLAGRVVVISPGHGWTYLEDCNCYSLQRAHQGAIVEDVLNAEIAMQLYALLTNAGATVYSTRNLDPNAGIGESGHPRWQENARQHLKALGLPEEIWNDANIALTSDIYARPLYANYLGADIFISIHNDIGGASGTSVIYDTHEHHGAGGLALAQSVHDAVIARLRTDYNPDWVSRGVRGYSAYGEIRLADMPAILIEAAFMDTPEPDYQALLDPRFKYLVAFGIYEGVLNYFTGMPPADHAAPGSTEPTDLPPLQPGMLRAPVAVVV